MNDNNCKVYVSGFAKDVDETGIRECLEAAKVLSDPASSPMESQEASPVTNIIVKRSGDTSYAFLDFATHEQAVNAIQKLNGFTFRSSDIRAEFSESRRNTSPKVQISDVPSSISISAIEEAFSKLGITHSGIEERERDGEMSKTVTLNFETKDQAESAVRQINESDVEGTRLKAKVLERRSPKRAIGGAMNMNANSNMNTRNLDFPLRILVQPDMVGAIIGRGGQTIKQITQETRARVDVHRKDNLANSDKAITIYGHPENCSNACYEILKVMKDEAKSMGKSDDISLRILAHNNLIGRIIGKQGGTIKKIMEETNTKITVSSINEINTFNQERVITITGDIEQISKAEIEISAKLRAAYEHDIQAITPSSMMFPGLHPTAMMSTTVMLPPQAASGYHPGMAAPVSAPPVSGPPGANGRLGPPNAPMMAGFGIPRPGLDMPIIPQIQETVYLYVPNKSVGAIIGSKGNHIKNIIKFSGANVKIAQTSNDGQSDEMPTHQDPSGEQERKVTIFGNPESQWKAQYLIYEKLREEGFGRQVFQVHPSMAMQPAHGALEEVRLTAEILVPSSQVGRIIGKAGASVKELQKVTGAVIKFPDQKNASNTAETPVQMTGNFYSVQSAQRRVRALIQMSNQQPNGNPHLSQYSPSAVPIAGPRAGQHQQQHSQAGHLNGMMDLSPNAGEVSQC